MTYSVFINGINGQMGSLTDRLLQNHPDFNIIGGASSKEDYLDKITQLKADFIIDFTQADQAYSNAKACILQGISIIVGTSGINENQYNELNELALSQKICCWVVPNFSVGALLMMQFSQTAAKFYEHVDITETHHLRKKDKPSGTAINTQERIFKIKPNIHCQIHSKRLPGSLAEQIVTFGGEHEHVSISHRSHNRESFSAGIMYCCQNISKHQGLIIGLNDWINPV